MVIYMKICFQNIGIILIHSFEQNMNEIISLSQRLRLLGYKVETPFSEMKKEINKTTINEWLKSVEDTFLQLKNTCKDVILIGFSMGGLLSLNLASKHKVKGIITLNTPIFTKEVISIFKKIPFKVYINIRKLLRKTKKLIPRVHCDILINQAVNNILFHKSTNYLYKKIPSKTKKKMFYRDQYEDVLIDLVKYIETV